MDTALYPSISGGLPSLHYKWYQQKQYHFGSLFVTDFIHEKAHYYCMNERRNRMYSTIDECY